MAARRAFGFRLGLFLGTGRFSAFHMGPPFGPPGVWVTSGILYMDCAICREEEDPTNAKLEQNGFFYCNAGHSWHMSTVQNDCRSGCTKKAELAWGSDRSVVFRCADGHETPV
jgi:hypothetical protein